MKKSITKYMIPIIIIVISTVLYNRYLEKQDRIKIQIIMTKSKSIY